MNSLVVVQSTSSDDQRLWQHSWVQSTVSQQFRWNFK